MIPEVGQKLGPYEVLGWLAGGGMAGVFRAWDGRLHREVAIKLVHDRSAMAEMRERFLREARVVSGLNHPNICTIFDIGEQDGELYLVMELLEGETLRERIAAGPLAGQTGWTSQFGLLAELPSGGHLPLEFAPSDESAVAPGSAPALREQRP